MKLKIKNHDNYEKGIKKLKLIGKSAEEAMEKLYEISPDLVQYAIEYTCGDIYSRPGLESKHREMIAIAALTVSGHSLPQLKLHIEGALRSGVSIIEIKEIIIQMSVYGGWPVVFNAMLTAKEVFDQYDNQNKI
jgi:4-carboxymuconolactone decarboxylase